jgi:type IV pilus assembly protein PilP
MMRKPLFTGIFLLALLSLVGGCGDRESKPAAKAPAPEKAASPMVKKQAPQSKEPEAEIAPPVYVYDPAGKRDPFEALLTVRKPVSDSGAPLTPLEKFDLGQFRLAGIIIGKDEPMAMVMAPGGKSYILKKGIKIGKNAGTVVAIQEDGVLVEERFYDFSGAFRKSIQKIQLPEREGV